MRMPDARPHTCCSVPTKQKRTRDAGRKTQFVAMPGQDGEKSNDQVVMEKVLKRVARRLGTPSEFTESKFSAMMHVYKQGHMKNVAALNRHPTVDEVMDKFVFIYSTGVTLPQVWHVDASGNVTSSFGMITAGLPTRMLSTIREYTVPEQLTFVGVEYALSGQEARTLGKWRLTT
jgi:hypothetical protein